MVIKIKAMMNIKNRLGLLLALFVVASGINMQLHAQPMEQETSGERLLEAIKVINDGTQAYAEKNLIVCLVDPQVVSWQAQIGSEIPPVNRLSRMMWHIGNYFGSLFKSWTKRPKYKTLYAQDGSVDAIIGPSIANHLLTLCWLSPARLMALGVQEEQLNSNLRIIGDVRNKQLMMLLHALGVVIENSAEDEILIDTALTHPLVGKDSETGIPVQIILSCCPEQEIAEQAVPLPVRSIDEQSTQKAVFDAQAIQELYKRLDAVVIRAADQKQKIETDAQFKENVRLGRVVAIRNSDECNTLNEFFETKREALPASFARWQHVMALAVSCFDLCAIGHGDLPGSFENIQHMVSECKQEVKAVSGVV